MAFAYITPSRFRCLLSSDSRAGCAHRAPESLHRRFPVNVDLGGCTPRSDKKGPGCLGLTASRF